MGVDPQKKVEGTPPLHSLFSPLLPLDVGPLNPDRRSGGALYAPQQSLGGAPDEIEFDAF